MVSLQFIHIGEMDDVVPHMSITFSQPMVALSSVDDVSAQGNAGVILEPEVKGKQTRHIMLHLK